MMTRKQLLKDLIDEALNCDYADHLAIKLFVLDFAGRHISRQEKQILVYVQKNRPCQSADVAKALNISHHHAATTLKALADSQLVLRFTVPGNDGWYYTPNFFVNVSEGE